MSIRVALVFPLRVTPDRQEAWDVTREIVPSLYPFDFVLTVDSGDIDFNRSASRNIGVVVAEEQKCDVVVVCDADSIPQKQPLLDAINGAHSDGLMHFPFDEAWYVDWKGLLRVKQCATPEQVKSRIWDKCPSEGGAWVCRPETWWKAGGQDPSLAHWGCDDRAFLASSRTLVGMPQKHEGILYCLPHHRPPKEETWVPEEVHLLAEYESRYQQPQQMREFIDARANYTCAIEAASEECSATVRVVQGYVHS